VAEKKVFKYPCIPQLISQAAPEESAPPACPISVSSHQQGLCHLLSPRGEKKKKQNTTNQKNPKTNKQWFIRYMQSEKQEDCCLGSRWMTCDQQEQAQVPRNAMAAPTSITASFMPHGIVNTTPSLHRVRLLPCLPSGCTQVPHALATRIHQPETQNSLDVSAAAQSGEEWGRRNEATAQKPDSFLIVKLTAGHHSAKLTPLLLRARSHCQKG